MSRGEEPEVALYHAREHYQKNYHYMQRFWQEGVKLLTTASSSYLISIPAYVLLDSTPAQMTTYIVNGVVLDISRILFNQQPRIVTRSTQTHQCSKGTWKVIGMHYLAATFVVLVGGTALSEARMRYLNTLAQSSNRWHQALAFIWQEEAFAKPLFGVVGYLSYRGSAALFMWASNLACSTYDIEKKLRPHSNFLQEAGKNILRWFNAVATTEAIFYYVDYFAQTSISQDPRIQIAILLGSDVALQLGNYIAFVPHPIASLVKVQDRIIKRMDEESAITRTEVVPANGTHYVKALGYKAFAHMAVMGVTYGLSTLTCVIASAHDADICIDNTFANRMIRYSVSLGGALAVRYGWNYVEKGVKEKLSYCCMSLFYRHQEKKGVLETSAEERKPILIK